MYPDSVTPLMVINIINIDTILTLMVESYKTILNKLQKELPDSLLETIKI